MFYNLLLVVVMTEPFHMCAPILTEEIQLRARERKGDRERAEGERHNTPSRCGRRNEKTSICPRHLICCPGFIINIDLLLINHAYWLLLVLVWSNGDAFSYGLNVIAESKEVW